MSDVELLGAYWTLAAGAQPWSDHEYCPFDLLHRARAAAQAGFRGMGFWHTDLQHLRRAYSFKQIRQVLDDHGITHVEVEFLLDWFMGGERRQKSDSMRAFLLDAAEGMRAHHIKVGDFFNERCPMPKMVEEFASLCKDARERGTNILYEITPQPFSRINTLDEALALTRGAGARNGGLMLDIWHVVRMGMSNEEIAGKLRDTDLIAAELNDGSLEAPIDMVDATVNHRSLVGDGEFDIEGFLAAVRTVGYRGPYGVEVLRADMREWPLETIATRVFDSTMTAFRS